MRPDSVSRRARTVLISAVALHLLFMAALPLGFLDFLFIEASEGQRQASDFFGIYQAGANLVHGYSIYDSADYRHEAPLYVPFYYFYRYLPPTAFLFGGISLVLPPWPAYWVWVVICELILLAVVRSILRDTRWPRTRRYLAASLWLGFFPFLLEQIMGQFSNIMAALLWVLWRAEIARTAPATVEGPAASPRNGSPRSSAPVRTLWAARAILERWRRYRWSEDRMGSRGGVLAWSGGMVLKTFPVLFAVPFLRDRRLKLVLAGGTLAAAASLPYFIFRPEDLREFVRLNFSPFTPVLHKGSFGLHNLLRDAVSHLPGPFLGSHWQIGPVDVTLPGMLVLLVGGVILLLALWGTIRLVDHPERATLDMALWTLAFFLTFKSIWEYHYVMLLPVLTAAYLTTGSSTVLWLGVLLGLPTLYPLTNSLAGVPGTTPFREWPGWYRIIHLGVKSFPTLALFLWTLHRAWAPRSRLREGSRIGTAPAAEPKAALPVRSTAAAPPMQRFGSPSV